MYNASVNSLKAHVVNGRIVVDDPVDLPEGAELDVYVDSATLEDRAALHRALERSAAQANAGELIDAHDVLAELDHRS